MILLRLSAHRRSRCRAIRCPSLHRRRVLAQFRRVRENYHMMDDEFQLPILEALYLADTTVAPSTSAHSCAEVETAASHASRCMLREIALVATETPPFARNPLATNLVSFVKSDSTHWRSASWRDSDVGYATGASRWTSTRSGRRGARVDREHTRRRCARSGSPIVSSPLPPRAAQITALGVGSPTPPRFFERSTFGRAHARCSS